MVAVLILLGNESRYSFIFSTSTQRLTFKHGNSSVLWIRSVYISWNYYLYKEIEPFILIHFYDHLVIFNHWNKTQRSLQHLAIHLINSSLQLTWNNGKKHPSNKSPNLCHLENFRLKIRNWKGQKSFCFSSASEEKGNAQTRNSDEKLQEAVFLPKDYLKQWFVPQFICLLLGVSSTLLICVLFSFHSVHCWGNKVCFN